MVYILPRNRASSLVPASRITPPWRGSRREGEARSRAGGGGTRRPVSDDQRHYRRQGGGNWLAPPPHQPSPAGSASATPPRGGSDTRGTNRGCRSHIRPGTWFTSCQGIGQEALCRPQASLPPGGGVGERAKPAVEPVGGGTRRPVSDDQRHYRRQGGGNWLAPPTASAFAIRLGDSPSRGE